MTQDARLKELESLIQASESHREHLKQLWLRIENLNAAIETANDGVAESKRHQAERNESHNRRQSPR